MNLLFIINKLNIKLESIFVKIILTHVFTNSQNIIKFGSIIQITFHEKDKDNQANLNL